jgi:lysophospholipase L1-like esterase
VLAIHRIEYVPDASERTNKIANKIMKTHGVFINDLYGFIKPDVDKYQLPNNCHFNSEGYERMGKKVAEVILEALKTRTE